jgi:UDP-GlcNAc:undecaprenyl-phosphate/decaprenyl-phosphate GlcNAc-1-phosphate transferase
VIALAAAVAFAVSVGTQPLVMSILRDRAVLDHPNERSSHQVATLRGGGLAVAVAALAGLAIVAIGGIPVAATTASVVCMGVIGAAEDFRGVSVRARLLAQLTTGALVGLILVSGSSFWHIVAVAAAAVYIAAFTNAFNFMDGVNGISSLNAFVSGGALACVGVMADLPVVTAAGAVVSAAALGFLPWNFGTAARVFLGDSGSYALGGALATVSTTAIVFGVPLEAAVAPLAIYVADTSWTLVHRWRAGEALHQAHRSHVYQRLTSQGWSHQRVAGWTALTSLSVSVCGLMSFAGTGAGRVVADAFAAIVIGAYLKSPEIVGRRVQHTSTRNDPQCV